MTLHDSNASDISLSMQHEIRHWVWSTLQGDIVCHDRSVCVTYTYGSKHVVICDMWSRFYMYVCVCRYKRILYVKSHRDGQYISCKITVRMNVVQPLWKWTCVMSFVSDVITCLEPHTYTQFPNPHACTQSPVQDEEDNHVLRMSLSDDVCDVTGQRQQVNHHTHVSSPKAGNKLEVRSSCVCIMMTLYVGLFHVYTS